MTNCILITEHTEELFKPLIPNQSITWVVDNKDMVLIGGIRDNAAVAVMVCGVIEDHIKILYIVVAEEYRRQRVATDMVEFVCIYASEYGYMVSCDFASENPILDPVAKVFDTLGYFTKEELEGYECILPKDSIKKFASKYFGKKYGYKYSKYSDIPKPAFNYFMTDLIGNGQLLYDPQNSRIIKELSLAALDKAGRVIALLVAEYQIGCKDKIKISYAYCDKENAPALIALLAIFGDRCVKLGEVLKEVKVEAVNNEAVHLIDRIVPERIITRRYYRCTWNLQFC